MTLELLSRFRSEMMGFAILWVIIYHYHGGNANTFLEGLPAMGFGGVDIFLLLSGLGLYHSFSQRTQIKFFYIKRFLRIIPTYYLIIIISGIILNKSITDICFNLSTIGFWIGKSYYDWYIPSLLILYIVFPFYYNSLIRNPLLSFFIWSIPPILISAILIYIWKGTVLLFFSRVPVFLLGALLAHMIKNKVILPKSLLYSIIFFSFLLFFLQIFILINHDWIYMNKSGLGTFPFIIIAPSICLLLGYILNFFNSKTSILRVIGNYSLEIYLCHMSLNINPWYIYVPLTFLAAYFLKQISLVLIEKLTIDLKQYD